MSDLPPITRRNLPPSSGVDSADKPLTGIAMSFVTSVEQLEAIYGEPNNASTVKVADRVTPLYRQLIEASPFAALATSGPEGLDCSPRGDQPGFIRIHNDRTLMLPDRRGNNRVDTLRNIVRDPRIALMLLIPGAGTTLRINGHAQICINSDLLATFEVDGKAPRSVIVMTVIEIYFQCARAIVRSDLWNSARHVDPETLPTPGQILADMSDSLVGGEAYDRQWPERARQTMW
jgi:PPOX class probable FMN-dependent enzyme